MGDDYRHSAPGLIGWLIIILLALFFGTKNLWFNELHPADKALFWTNVAVAAGTLALAGVTWWNVRQTTLVISGEDRRHQQSYAPFLLLESGIERIRFEGLARDMPRRYVALRNDGLGIATDVYIYHNAFEEPLRTTAVAPSRSQEVPKFPIQVPDGSISVRYKDMFGNEYTTEYPAAGNFLSYEWHQPKHLRTPKPKPVRF